MSQPAKPFQPQQLTQTLKRQSWVVLAIVLIGLGIDLIMGHQGEWVVTKNLLSGSVLAWVGQLIFAKIALGVSGARHRRQIVHRFYIGHMVKWVVSLVGFALIFIALKPLSALWVFAGFMLVQASYILWMYRFKRQ